MAVFGRLRCKVLDKIKKFMEFIQDKACAKILEIMNENGIQKEVAVIQNFMFLKAAIISSQAENYCIAKTENELESVFFRN